ncbi:MAG: MmcQ/YjbR family DNA-binding protein [Paramuribaculum sp.]|jgi:predicted DNA-binding protein (MmcQ/YjbR family)
MNIEEVREYGLSLPHATERYPFVPDTLTLEIGGRMFCLMTLDGRWDFYNLKIDPDYSIELRDRFTGIRPGFHQNKRHWVSVDFYGNVPDSLQRELIYHSYCQAASMLPRKIQKALGFDH